MEKETIKIDSLPLETRIIFLSWKDKYHPNRGGAETVLWEYAHIYAKKGYSVEYICPKHANIPQDEKTDGITYIRMGGALSVYVMFFFYYMRKLRHQKTPTVIIDQAGGVPFFTPLYVKKIPCFLFVHHMGEKELIQSFQSFIGKIFAKHLMRLYFFMFACYKNSLCFTVSNSTKQDLILNHGFKESAVCVLQNTISVDAYRFLRPIPDIPKILFLSRIAPAKYVEEAIEIFEIVQKAIPNAQLHICGNDADRHYAKKIQKRIENSSACKNITKTAFHPGSLASVVSNASLLCMTSHKEGFGLVILEANMYGVPAVGYRVPGIEEAIVPNVNGQLFTQGDIQASAHYISDILQDNTQLSMLSKSSYDHVSGLHSWVDLAEKSLVFIQQNVS